MAVNRQTKVEVSAFSYAKVKLEEVGYDEDKLVFLEEFPYENFEGDLTRHNYCAFGFNFDDNGAPAELGSTLKRRIYTLEFFVFGVDELNAKSIANELKFAVDVDEMIPLFDVGQPAPPPVVNQMLVKGASAAKVLVAEPKPHERHVWLTTVRIEDEYYASEL